MRFACCCFDAVKYKSKIIGKVIRQMMMAMVCMIQSEWERVCACKTCLEGQRD